MRDIVYSGQGVEVARIIIPPMLRLVLDTNVVLDLFHWGNTDAVPIMAALEAGNIECFVDARTLNELKRVLTYPQLKLTPDMMAERYARYSALVQVFPEGEAPICWSARTRPCSACAGERRWAFRSSSRRRLQRCWLAKITKKCTNSVVN